MPFCLQISSIVMIWMTVCALPMWCAVKGSCGSKITTFSMIQACNSRSINSNGSPVDNTNGRLLLFLTQGNSSSEPAPYIDTMRCFLCRNAQRNAGILSKCAVMDAIAASTSSVSNVRSSAPNVIPTCHGALLRRAIVIHIKDGHIT